MAANDERTSSDREGFGARPWFDLYPEHIRSHIASPYASLPAAWRERVARAPGRTAVAYFDGALSAREVDETSDALAVVLQEHGVRRGDHVGVHLQNVPQYPLLLLALWKVGAAALLLNPMYRHRELRGIIDDAKAVGVVCDETEVDDTVEALRGSSVRWILSTSSMDLQARNDERVFPDTSRRPAAPDGDLLARCRDVVGRSPDLVDIGPDDVALLTYTSGTTGFPKGAMNTHRGVLQVATSYGAWTSLAPGDVVLGLAPLFHITGAVINATLALLHDTTLVLTHRFRADVVLDAIAEHGVTSTIGSITAFNALSELPYAGREHFASFTALYSGGAPIPPTTVKRFAERFGVYIHNAYGMTESSSGVIAVPLNDEAPVHEPSGTLSIGVPLPAVDIRVVGPDGRRLPFGEQGELQLAGDHLMSGYWNRPDATRTAMPDGWLRTGDVAICDERGWVYLVDRLKDQINVSGYKVWPREVEDALYEHPDVLEAAVVGRPDDYQGESVVAYVSPVAGRAVDSEQLRTFIHDRLAAYKVPREIHVVGDLPKTLTGKIRRNELREREQRRGNET